MKNLNPLFSKLSYFKLSFWKPFLTVLLLFGFAQASIIGQTKISADAILQKIDREEAVEITDAVITGDLDFTKLEKKYKGGSYGVRVGMVKEFYGKLKSPLVLKNCTVKGDVITRSDEKTPGVLKEYFTAFDANVVFENCRFEGNLSFEQLTFQEGITIRNCVFEENLAFENVHFAKPPMISGNDYKGKLVIEKTNWSEKTEQLIPPPPKDENVVTFTIKNSSLQTIYFKFGKNTWNVSPLGSSGITTSKGEGIYLVKDGKKDRLLFTASAEYDGKTVDITKL